MPFKVRVGRAGWTRAVAVLTAAVVSACSADSTGPNVVAVKKVASVYCPDMLVKPVPGKLLNLMDDCSVEGADAFEAPYISFSSEEPTSTETWTGDPALFSSGGFVAGPCPEQIGWTIWARHANSGKLFGFRGPLAKTGRSVPMGYNPFTHAYYWSLWGDPETRDGNWRLLEGEIFLSCRSKRVVLEPFGSVELWWVRAVGAIGQVQSAGGGGGFGNEDAGWVNFDGSGQATGMDGGNPSGGGWMDAKHNWEVHHQCTVGYVVIDDGFEMCDGSSDEMH